MRTALPSYCTYKRPRARWLVSIPSNWKTLAIGRLFQRVKRTGFPNAELLSVYRDHGVVVKSSRDDNFNKSAEDLNSYQLVRPGDLVMNKMKTWQGSIAMSDQEGIVSPAYFVYQPRTNARDVFYPKYLHYLVRSPIYVAQYLSRSKGIRVNQWDLDPGAFEQIELLLPPLDEQSQIAQFLDRETVKINKLVDKQQQLISLLTEKRQAVISHAVTKGLNPNAPLRNSGIQWLGKVPAHWTIQKTAWHFAAEKGHDAQQLTKEYCGAHKGPFPVYSGQTANYGIMGRISRHEFDVGPQGVLFSTTVGARAMQVSHLFGKFSLSQNCLILHSRSPGFHVRFAYYAFVVLFKFERLLIPDHMQPSFRLEDFYQYRIVQPPVHEQKQIAQWLDVKTAKLDTLLEKQHQSIRLLQERRTALISAAVTGKIDVRNGKPPEPVA